MSLVKCSKVPEGVLDLLTAQEYVVLCSYMPARFLSGKKDRVCCVCGKEGTAGNPLQLAHKIPHADGIRVWGIRPEVLESPLNVCTAHRKTCNKKCELTDLEIMRVFEKADVTPPNHTELRDVMSEETLARLLKVETEYQNLT